MLSVHVVFSGYINSIFTHTHVNIFMHIHFIVTCLLLLSPTSLKKPHYCNDQLEDAALGAMHDASVTFSYLFWRSAYVIKSICTYNT